MTFADEREAVGEVDEARGRERREERDGERDLEDQIRGVARLEVCEGRVCGDDERVVVHRAERFVREVNDVEDRRCAEEALHARAAISETNSTTALSI